MPCTLIKTCHYVLNMYIVALLSPCLFSEALRLGAMGASRTVIINLRGNSGIPFCLCPTITTFVPPLFFL